MTVAETGVTILLKSKSKKVTIPRRNDQGQDNVISDNEGKTEASNDTWGGQTPAYGGNSPGFLGYQTPAPGLYESVHHQ